MLCISKETLPNVTQKVKEMVKIMLLVYSALGSEHYILFTLIVIQ